MTTLNKFYTFRQNNSGGGFIKDDQVDVYVIIEARDADEANVRAEAVGIYFNGCYDGIDCSCCGDRWHRKDADAEGEKVPSIYGMSLDYRKATKTRVRDTDTVIHFDNGKVVYMFGDGGW